MTDRIRKAVFPVAGLGTRFLPATKATPKEMLPVVDKPLIQYAVEEAVEAGIEMMVFVTGRNKNAIPDHFDKAYELESELTSKGKVDTLEALRAIVPANIVCVYVRQPEALGLGHAVHCAKTVIGDEPFAVILADDLINNANAGCLSQMVELFETEKTSLVGVQQVPLSQTKNYGIVETDEIRERVSQVKNIVEKPDPEVARSNLGVVGRYILTPQIFDELEQTGRGAGGEIQLTDAISSLLAKQRVVAYEFEGNRYDCGSKLGYLIATVEYGLQHNELGPDFKSYLKRLVLN